MRKTQGGQIALIVLLIMVVMLTVGISVAQRGLVDVRLSQQEEDSARAFQAAEAGIEQALSTLAGGEGEFGEDTSYKVSIGQSGGEGFTTDQPILAGEMLKVSLEGSSTNLNGVTVYFMEKGKDDCDVNPAAIEVSVVYNPGSDWRVRRGTFDVAAVSRGNSFTEVTKGNYDFLGKTFCAQSTLTMLPGTDREVRIKPLYNAAIIGVDPRPDNAILVNQYVEVDSTGQTTGGVTRAVQVRRNLPELPSIFDYAVFSGAGIVKGE
ncbi:MAG: pilus assembly PilX N-terminal domain-containing protein [Candidatus Chisholmbacteria bacterium]|nr:pilus assembly PilX N-terminal domain-containing protein [Candidatus Chisholmbacteria bacterium]